MKTAIVISDLRSVPVMAALNIFRKASLQGDAILVASERLFYKKEYADYTPIIWKLFLLNILRFFCKLTIVSKRKNSKLTSSDKLGLISSLYSITEDSGADETKYPALYASLCELTLGSKEVVDYLKMTNDVNVIYVFNGRTASSYLITKYAHKQKIITYYYEYARGCNGYRLFPRPPHSSGDIGKIVLDFGKESCLSSPVLYKMSKIFSEQKLNNQFSLSNKNTCKKTYDISIYLGSDHEYTAVDPEICNIEWLGNIGFIQQVVEKYGVNITYAIRCHPNQSADRNWKELVNNIEEYISSSGAQIDLYKPDSGVSSHDLMKNSKIVATDLSSIAVDAVLLGYNVDVFGNTELKQFLNVLNTENINSGSMRVRYVSQLLSVYEILFVIRFSRLEKYICGLYFIVHHGFKKIKSYVPFSS